MLLSVMLDKTEGCWPWSETLSVEDNAICQDRLTLLMDQLEQKSTMMVKK